MLKKYNILVVILFLGAVSYAGEPSKTFFSANDYISIYKSKAVNQMLMHGIPASITLAQGMLESGNGNSDLAVGANNHFGIKCHKEWSGPSFIKDDDEKNECFRKYENVNESYNDHSLFLKTRPRYAFLFQLQRTDYIAWARGLKSAGYATHPEYAEKLIDLIEKNRLFELDTLTSSIEENFAKANEEKKNSNVLSLETGKLVELIKNFDLNSLKEDRFANSISERLKNLYLPKPTNSPLDLSGMLSAESRNSVELSPEAGTEAGLMLQDQKTFVFANLDLVKENCYNYFTSLNFVSPGVQFFVMERSTENCKNVSYFGKLYSCSPARAGITEVLNASETIPLIKISAEGSNTNQELSSEKKLLEQLQALCNLITTL